MKRRLISIAIIAIGGVYMMGCTSTQRTIEDIETNIGELNRTVEVYTHTGEKIREYKGKVDLAGEDSASTKIDLNGKRVIIKDAIVIIEED